MLFLEKIFKLFQHDDLYKSEKVSSNKRSINYLFEIRELFSNQMFSKRYIKSLGNVGPKGKSIATPSHCSQNFPLNIKNYQTWNFRQVIKRTFTLEDNMFLVSVKVLYAQVWHFQTYHKKWSIKIWNFFCK